MWRNKVREKKWNKMSSAEKKTYLNSFVNDKNDDEGRKETANDAKGGNKRLDFRFVH